MHSCPFSRTPLIIQSFSTSLPDSVSLSEALLPCFTAEQPSTIWRVAIGSLLRKGSIGQTNYPMKHVVANSGLITILLLINIQGLLNAYEMQNGWLFKVRICFFILLIVISLYAVVCLIKTHTTKVLEYRMQLFAVAKSCIEFTFTLLQYCVYIWLKKCRILRWKNVRCCILHVRSAQKNNLLSFALYQAFFKEIQPTFSQDLMSSLRLTLYQHPVNSPSDPSMIYIPAQ